MSSSRSFPALGASAWHHMSWPVERFLHAYPQYRESLDGCDPGLVMVCFVLLLLLEMWALYGSALLTLRIVCAARRMVRLFCSASRPSVRKGRAAMRIATFGIGAWVVTASTIEFFLQRHPEHRKSLCCRNSIMVTLSLVAPLPLAVWVLSRLSRGVFWAVRIVGGCCRRLAHAAATETPCRTKSIVERHWKATKVAESGYLWSMAGNRLKGMPAPEQSICTNCANQARCLWRMAS